MSTPELNVLYKEMMERKQLMLRMWSHTNIIPDDCKHRRAYLEAKFKYDEELRKYNDNT